MRSLDRGESLRGDETGDLDPRVVHRDPNLERTVEDLAEFMGGAEVRGVGSAHGTEQHTFAPGAGPCPLAERGRLRRPSSSITPPHRLAELSEVLMGCGLRVGEALALRWIDLDIEARVLLVRRTLVEVGGYLSFGEPKTKGSAAGVGLSSRVVAALQRQRDRVEIERMEWAEAYQDGGLVFPLEDGRPTRSVHVRRHLHALSDAAGVRRCRVHDLRHLAATLMLTNGHLRVPQHL